MKYDEQFLLKAAARLEQQARELVFTTTAKFGIVALGVSFLGAEIMTYFAKTDFPVAGIVFIATGIAVIGGIIEGRARAFQLRVQVNQLLALVQIEHNTHRPNLEV